MTQFKGGGKRELRMSRFLPEDQKVANFWRQLVLPQEDKDLDHRWQGIGYRWFRSENVYCLEHYRVRRVVKHSGNDVGGNAA
jgi:hypothetical protein